MLTINVSGDTTIEPDEGFTVTLSNPSNNGTISVGSANGTILNDDSASLSINSVSLNEGNSGTSPFVFTVTLSNPSASTVTVLVNTANGSASTADNDYAAIVNQTVTFNPGVTSQTVTVNVNGDRNVELDETFTVNLSNANGATIGTGTGIGTIINDDFPEDFGDAPAPFPTLLANNGARHRIVAGIRLGAAIDVDVDGQPSTLADGDDNNPVGGPDDEDGVTFASLIIPGQFAAVDVVASSAGLLNAWLDLNHDGDWADAGEQIFLNTPLVAGLNNLSFFVPASATLSQPEDPSFARFRFSTVGGLSYTGVAPDGEVEDYAVAITLPSTRFFDFNTDSSPTQQGYIGVTPGMVYDPAVRRFGWMKTMIATGFTYSGAFDNGSLGVQEPESDLLRDGHFRQRDYENTFQVDLPNGDYVVNIKLGNAQSNRDFMDFYAEGVLQLGGMFAQAGKYYHRSFVTTVADGRLDLLIRDAGGDAFWIINALEITPAPGGAIVLCTDVGCNPPTNNVLADGTTVDTYTFVGATPNNLVTVVVNKATLLAPDRSAAYEGIQVLANSTGRFQVQVQRPSGSVQATITVGEVSAATSGTATINYVAPNGWRFDMNASGSPVQAGYQSVEPDTLYTAQRGFGWLTGGAGGFNRGTLSGSVNSPLLQDGHWSPGKGPLTFAADVFPGTYDVTITFGDSFARDNIQLQSENGGSSILVNVPNTAANQFRVVEFNATDNGDGILNITIRDLGGDPYWLLNGLDIALGGTASLPALPQQLDASAAGDGRGSPDLLTASALVPIVDEAIARWTATGLTSEQVAALSRVEVRVASLEPGYLGLANSQRVLIDDDASGLGWFVDSTPGDDREFASVNGELLAPAGTVQGIDLLSVVLHELGHVLGHVDLDSHGPDLMSGQLAPGTRRLPSADHDDHTLAADGSQALTAAPPSATRGEASGHFAQTQRPVASPTALIPPADSNPVSWVFGARPVALLASAAPPQPGPSLRPAIPAADRWFEQLGQFGPRPSARYRDPLPSRHTSHTAIDEIFARFDESLSTLNNPLDD